MDALGMGQAHYVGYLEDMRRMASAKFRHLDLEAREEAVQNSLALAWQAYRRLVLQGRGDEPGLLKSCLYYSIRQTKAGRTLARSGAAGVKDIHVRARLGRAKIERMDIRHLVSDTTPVPDQVSFRIDIPRFLGTLPDRQRRLALALAMGLTTKEAAAKYGVTPSAISQFRQRFRDLLEQFLAI
jgi:DNA-directed RNA polymerase specialized sigma24 family protein